MIEDCMEQACSSGTIFSIQTEEGRNGFVLPIQQIQGNNECIGLQLFVYIQVFKEGLKASLKAIGFYIRIEILGLHSTLKT